MKNLIEEELYSPKFDVLYYNIPKCGMTSVVKDMGFIWKPLSEVKDKKVFTVLRDPIKRVVSSYNTIRQLLLRNDEMYRVRPITQEVKNGITHKDQQIGFNYWLDEIYNNGFIDSHDLPQLFYLTLDDHIGSLKSRVMNRSLDNINLFLDFDNLNAEIKNNFNFDISHKNKSTLSKIILTTEQLDMVKTLYSDDIKLYNKKIN